MKRKIITIIIILLTIALVVGGLWMLARNKATKNNTTPPTFKEFLGLGVSKKPQPGNGTDNTVSSDFVNPPEEVPTTPAGTKAIPVGTSVFTDNNGSPQTGLGLGLGTGGLGLGLGTGGLGLGLGTGNGGAGTIGGGGASSGGGTSSGGGGAILINPAPPLLNPPECSAADLTIQFTPEEINRLNVLKTRFFVIAETLNTDADVNTEISNYDTFKARSRKIADLYNYCIGKNDTSFQTPYEIAKPTVAPATVAPAALAVTSGSGGGGIGVRFSGGPQGREAYGSVVPGENGEINYRVPTPFWHDLTKDNQALVHQGSNWMGIFSDPDLIFPERSIEHALRLNLW